MHDEPLNPEHPSQSASEPLDRHIVRALEAAPEPQIPADFAARVASRLPASRPVSLTPTHYGQNALLLGVVATLVALLVLAMRSTGHTDFGLLESILSAQFVALAVWLSVWRARHSLR
jgi:hypothetical protein